MQTEAVIEHCNSLGTSMQGIFIFILKFDYYLEFEMQKDSKSDVNQSSIIETMIDPLLHTSTTIILSDKFEFVQGKTLPDNIMSIEFACYYDKPIPNGCLPSKLVYLDFGHHFTQNINDLNIPASVEVLVCRHWFKSSFYFLSRRNLKAIHVVDTYMQVVPDSLLPIMSENYRSNYSLFQKLVPEKYRATVSGVDDRLFATQGDQDLKKQIKQIKQMIGKSYNQKQDSYHFESMEISVNNKGQIVMKIVYSFWEYVDSTYIGRNNVFYRVWRRETNVPKCRVPVVSDTLTGPFTIEQMIADTRTLL